MKKSIAKHLVSLGAAMFVLASCASTKQIVYFQDTTADSVISQAAPVSVTLKTADKVSIIVSSKDPELASVFNLAVVSHSAGYSQSTFGNTQNQVSAYTVDDAGNIDFPVLGTLHVEGLTRAEVAKMIKNQLIESNLIKDPVVTVEYASMWISVLGDVAHPGRTSLDKDHFTIIDALSKSGDLNVTGLRKTVKVFREVDGKQMCYVIDFTSAENVFNSPAYYLRQDDIVYVEPNKMKARQSTVNGNNVLSASFWLSVGSFATTIATFVIMNVNRK